MELLVSYCWASSWRCPRLRHGYVMHPLFICYVITHPCPNFNGGLTTLLLSYTAVETKTWLSLTHYITLAKSPSFGTTCSIGWWKYSCAIENKQNVFTLRWRQNERDGVSTHRRLNCLLSRLFRRWSKYASKLHATGLCEDNSPVTGEFPAQRASNAEVVCI